MMADTYEELKALIKDAGPYPIPEAHSDTMIRHIRIIDDEHLASLAKACAFELAARLCGDDFTVETHHHAMLQVFELLRKSVPDIGTINEVLAEMEQEEDG